MGVKEVRTQKLKLVKQQYIVDQTTRLIERIGIDNVTMDNIAQAAEYTKRTLYVYFKGKEEILLWVYTDDLIRRWEYQKKELELGKTGIEKLKIWAMSIYEYCDNNNHTLQIQKYMDYHSLNLEKVSDSIFDRFESINDDLANGLRDIFNLGIVDKSIRNYVEVDITISQFLYSYRAVLNRAFSNKYSFANFDKHKYINHFIELFTNSIN